MNIRVVLLFLFISVFIISTIVNIYSDLSSGNPADTLSGFYSLSVPMLALALWPDLNGRLSRNKEIGMFLFKLFLFIYAVALFTAMIIYDASWFLLFFESAMVLVTGILSVTSLKKLLKTKEEPYVE